MTYEEHTIRKKSGKIRKIVAPDAELKKYQRHELDTCFTPIFNKIAAENDLTQCFHGFVPRKNSVTAAAQHIGYKTTIMFDFANFFDTITYTHLEAGGITLTLEQAKYCLHKDGYCAQGFPSSPMLANIAIIPFVKHMCAWLKLETHDDFVFTIYADDIQISINSEDKRDWQQIRDRVYKQAIEHNLVINPSKTRVRFAKYGARRILGVNVTNDSVVATRKTNRKVRAVRHQVNTIPDSGKGQVLGGLRTWQGCHYPKGIDYNL